MNNSDIEALLKTESLKIKIAKKNFEYLDLELGAMNLEINEYTHFQRNKGLQHNADLSQINKNLTTAQNRRCAILALEQKLKMSRYNCITAVKNIKRESISKDLAEIRNLIFMVGNTLAMKVEEIEQYFSGDNSLDKILDQEDLGINNIMLTNYGKTIKNYFN